jgi:hypothetical protein
VKKYENSKSSSPSESETTVDGSIIDLAQSKTKKKAKAKSDPIHGSLGNIEHQKYDVSALSPEAQFELKLRKMKPLDLTDDQDYSESQDSLAWA